MGEGDANERYLALGRVVEAASGAEFAVRESLCGLLGSKYGTIIASGLTMSDMIECALTIAKVHDGLGPEETRVVVDLLERCKQLNERRNRIIHDSWVGHPLDATIPIHQIRVKRRAITWHYQIAASVEEINALADDMKVAAHQLFWVLLNTLGGETFNLTSQIRREAGPQGTLHAGLSRLLTSGWVVHRPHPDGEGPACKEGASDGS